MTLAQQVAGMEIENARLKMLERRLREERDDAREEVAQLRKLLEIEGTRSRIPHLPPVRARLLNLLLERDFVPRAIAEQAMTKGGTHNALTVHFSMLRRHLPKGVTIGNRRDQGWFIPKEQKTLLRA